MKLPQDPKNATSFPKILKHAASSHQDPQSKGKYEMLPNVTKGKCQLLPDITKGKILLIRKKTEKGMAKGKKLLCKKVKEGMIKCGCCFS